MGATIILAGADDGLRRGLRARGRSVISIPGAVRASEIVTGDSQGLVLVVCLANHTIDSSLNEIRALRSSGFHWPIFAVAAESSEELAILAFRSGISDYFAQPAALDALLEAVDGGGRIGPVRKTDQMLAADRLMVGSSLAVRELRNYLPKVAASNCNVLVTGETGTGKELVAETIHNQSLRSKKPFVCINCAAIPDTLLESELFGYERGAFTGAESIRDGKLHEADKGTIFFDEVGDMSPVAQAKVLRAIESGHVQRLGGKGSIPVDLRILAATNQDLEEQVSKNQFRKDLFFRMNVARIHLPPLRERREDIPVLLTHYLHYFNRRSGQDVQGFTDEVLDLLIHYDWPGNIRELKNVVEAIFVHQPYPRISIDDVPQQIGRSVDADRPAGSDREQLLAALLATKWNKSQAAQHLKLSRMTLYRKLARYGIEDQAGESKIA